MNDLTQCVVTPKVKLDGFDSLGVGVHRASTIVFKDAQAYATRGDRGDEGYTYGLYGTPTTRTLEAKITTLEGGLRTFLVPSGQAACSLAILALVKAGDKVLIADTAYPPVRDFADRDLTKFGIEVEYYDPTSLSDLEARMDERTRIVWCESPGSTTMEVQDIRAIAAIAHRSGALVGCDNTWATPLNFKPLEHGADIVAEALTKYFSGHSDVLMGSITVGSQDLAAPIRATLGRYGIGVSPDDASMVLRGMETMGIRLKHASEAAYAICEHFAQSRLVGSVLFPPRPDCPGHELWSRDFTGSSAVFSVIFTAEATPHVADALDVLKTFAIGASWGGTRSLMAPMPIKRFRTARPWVGEDLVLRISIGLEALSDLQTDVAAFLTCIAQAAGTDRADDQNTVRLQQK
ncbi:trans-sulfuration enzyme family protein [Pararhizobium sp.]|uniref:trans-sulfuration enzyme family protein n=1 Tax=Pararhizobium sp. TaxID=1977563 RepID=UPI0027280D2B|nr:PLP-dependent transferase [Pararhizobium sp.]MDO9415526.1 PLP-dependent transferase [Pararhizobium sp.]